MGFTGCIVDGGRPFGRDGSHDRIFRCHYTGFFKLQDAALKPFGLYAEFSAGFGLDPRSEFFKRVEMNMNRPQSDAVSAGEG